MFKGIIPNAQGEITIFHIEKLPENARAIEAPERDRNGDLIISHSEQGNHHVISGDTQLLEHPNPPEGMKILYAILDKPDEIRQNATVPHDTIALDAGVMMFRIRREYDPIMEQARQVAD